MSNAIEAEGLGKRYLLGEHGGSDSVRDALTDGLRRLTSRGPRPPREEVWALRDLDLAVPQGATLGVVGRNGAGKSTLLKVLARITEPTTGVSRTRGRIGSLLEVGTGFHPELSGRENVHLNAALLGMSRAETTRRFDDIVDFSGVGRFLDTPVKRYSSGMYLRLAFAVAAHVDAEVLLVDEVLAVGDAEFQRRCLGTMESLGRSGRTVVFISHNLDAVVRLCSTTLWLDQGRARALGPTDQVLDAYLREATPDDGVSRFPDVPGAPVAVRRLEVRGAGDRAAAGRVHRDEAAELVLQVVSDGTERGLDLAVSVETLTGVRVLDEALSDASPDRRPTALDGAGERTVRLTLPPLLMPGEYAVNVWLGTPYETHVWVHDAARLRVEGGDEARPDRLVRARGAWEVDAAAPSGTLLA